MNKQNILSFIEFSQKDDRLRFIFKLQIFFDKLIFKWEKVVIFVRKSKYVICFELNVRIMKCFLNLLVNSYISDETGILLTWIAKSIEAPLKE